MASLLFVGDAIAQLDVSDTSRWQCNANVSLRLNSGNVERTIVTPEANVAHIQRNKVWGFSARQRYTYGTFGSFKTEDDLLSRNFLYLFPEKRVYPYVMTWFQTHERQRLAFRYQVGPGITFVPLQRGTHVIKWSVTATYEHNTYRQAGLTYIEDIDVKRYEVFRATARVFGSHTFSQSIVSLYYELLFQQALEDGDNWRIFFESGVSTRISHGFSMRTYLNYEYQQVHVITEEPRDLILSVGLNYRVVGKL